MPTLELIFCIGDAHALFFIGYSNDIWQNPMSQRPVASADYVFDHIGIDKTMEQIVPAARSGHMGVERGGTANLVGVPTTPSI